jgi:hypothetical protein
MRVDSLTVGNVEAEQGKSFGSGTVEPSVSRLPPFIILPSNDFAPVLSKGEAPSAALGQNQGGQNHWRPPTK